MEYLRERYPTTPRREASPESRQSMCSMLFPFPSPTELDPLSPNAQRASSPTIEYRSTTPREASAADEAPGREGEGASAAASFTDEEGYCLDAAALAVKWYVEALREGESGGMASSSGGDPTPPSRMAFPPEGSWPHAEFCLADTLAKDHKM